MPKISHEAILEIVYEPAKKIIEEKHQQLRQMIFTFDDTKTPIDVAIYDVAVLFTDDVGKDRVAEILRTTRLSGMTAALLSEMWKIDVQTPERYSEWQRLGCPRPLEAPDWLREENVMLTIYDDDGTAHYHAKIGRDPDRMFPFEREHHGDDIKSSGRFVINY